jgi:hypothetical protein
VFPYFLQADAKHHIYEIPLPRSHLINLQQHPVIGPVVPNYELQCGCGHRPHQHDREKGSDATGCDVGGEGGAIVGNRASAGFSPDRVDALVKPPTDPSFFTLSKRKGPRIFQAQDRAIDDFKKIDRET